MGRKEKWCNAFVFLHGPKMSRILKILFRDQGVVKSISKLISMIQRNQFRKAHSCTSVIREI